ncbi:MAG TPA: hypothetical protein VFW09_12930 [Solirubrobacteraceae bacterium]|nr:hypothetical protein [Solirubrobacteraceae bacterium]
MALLLMCAIGVIVAALLVGPQMTRARAGSSTRVTGVSSQLLAGDVVTGVRGGSGHNVVLTGGVNEGTGLNPVTPFLVKARLTGPIAGTVSTFTPPFSGYKEGLFYGPDTHAFNPSSIPRGQVRAVGSYETSQNAGVVNQGMVYLGPVAGSGGSWSTIDVPADGKRVVGHTRACRLSRSNCFVMDTIPHSSMGDLVVGDYDLNVGGAHRAVSANAFIYNLTTHLWTLLKLGGGTSNGTTLYGIWQVGGDRSPHYTLAGGTSVRRHPKALQRAFLMNYNERTGAFGARRYFSYRNKPTLLTHFEGITGVPGGFNVVAQTANDQAGMGFIRVTRKGAFGPARWFSVGVATSSLCSGGCSVVTGNTVYRNHVMGIYIPASTNIPDSYLETFSGTTDR